MVRAWLIIVALGLCWLGVDIAGAQSLKDIVTESEGGKIPSLREMIPPSDAVTQPQKEGESHPAAPGIPVPEHGPDSTQSMKEGESDRHGTVAPDSTPPGDAEHGAAGRVPAPLTAWGFVAWAEDGSRMGGHVRDTQEECEALLERDRARYPDWAFSPCVWLRAARPTL